MSINNFKGRNGCIEEVVQAVKEPKKEHEDALQVYEIIGSSGLGKSYIIDAIQKQLGSCVTNIILEESRLCAMHNSQFRLSSFTFNFSNFGLSFERPEDKLKGQWKEAIDLFRTLSKKQKPIVLIIDDADRLSPGDFALLKLLIQYKAKLDLKTSVSIIYSTSTEGLLMPSNMRCYRLQSYAIEDVRQLLSNSELIRDEFILSTLELCKHNINLTVSILNSFDSNKGKPSLEKYIVAQIEALKQSLKKEANTDEELSELITHILKIIAYSKDGLNVDTVNIILGGNSHTSIQSSCILENATRIEFMAQKLNLFDFNSKEVKQGVTKDIAPAIGNDTPQKLYEHYTATANWEYATRLEYLLKANELVSTDALEKLKFPDGPNKPEDVLALLILGFQFALQLNDEQSMSAIEDLAAKSLNPFETDILLFHRIKQIYINFSNGLYKQVVQTLDMLVPELYISCNEVLLASLLLLHLKAKQISIDYKNREVIADTLLALTEEKPTSPLLIPKRTPVIVDMKSEPILNLSILCTLAPFYLDSLNDRATFEKLHERILDLITQLNQNKLDSVSAYIIHNYNRKAFIHYSNEMACQVYPRSIEFFKGNGYHTEHMLALVAVSGYMLSQGQFNNAFNALETAFELIESKSLEVPQIEKLYNNKHVIGFLKHEFDFATTGSVLDDPIFNAQICLENLQKIDLTSGGALRSVVLSNIASLALYTGNTDTYYATKTEMESIMRCEDISDVTNTKINDFYSYRFAWFELYIAMVNRDWTSFETKLQTLEGFVPSLHNEDSATDLRYKAALDILDNKRVLTPQEFCLNLLGIVCKDGSYRARGLGLSDLQFTAF